MRDFLKPVTTVEPRPTDPASSRYVRSYLILRATVGALGATLPFMLVLCDGLWFDGDPFPRSALSAYYYSGVRDVLVGTICATGIFLVAYKVAERNLDNTLSVFAGLAALAIALFPPRLPPDGKLSPLQERLGESVTAGIHFIAAAAFIVSLAVLSVFFGVREGKRKPKAGKLPPRFWRTYHWVCACLIGAALLWMGLTELLEWGPRESLLYAEGLSLLAFGASWLWKGLELDMLRGRPTPVLAKAVSRVP
jgi:Protein of unknown function (DUF998)